MLNPLIQTAVDTAEAIGTPLTRKTDSICFEPLNGYDYTELRSFVDVKALDKLVKANLKEALTQRPESLYLKPILINSAIWLVLGKDSEGKLICCRKGDDYRVAVSTTVSKLKLATDADLTEDFLDYHKEVKSRLEFAASIKQDLCNYKLDKCDETTNWEIGKDFIPYLKTIEDNTTSLVWGFNFFKVVFGKEGDERVLPCLLLEESTKLNLVVKA